MTLNRLEGWEARLAALVNAHRSTTYAYGTFDCWIFARAAVEAVTGTIVLPDLEIYRGWLGAARVLISHGWADVEAMATEALGEPRDASAARSGDVISYESGGEMHLAVRVGGSALTPGLDGIVEVERGSWRLSWPVG